MKWDLVLIFTSTLLTTSLTTEAFIIATAVIARTIIQTTIPNQTGINDIAIVSPPTTNIEKIPIKLIDINGKL
jgi:hypothetical protein